MAHQEDGVHDETHGAGMTKAERSELAALLRDHNLHVLS